MTDRETLAIKRCLNGWLGWYRKVDSDDDCEYLNGKGWDDAEALASTTMGVLAALQSPAAPSDDEGREVVERIATWLGEQFIDRALRSSTCGAAMIVRAAFLEGQGRYERLFSQTPPRYVLQFTERVVMHKGRLAPEGSTATAYAWLVWETDWCGETELHWIAPCRKRLEREDDYPSEARAA